MRIRQAIAIAAFFFTLFASRPAFSQPVSGQYTTTTCASPLASNTDCTSAALSSNTTVNDYLIIVNAFGCMDVGCANPQDIAGSAVSGEGDTFTKCFDRYGSGSQLATAGIWYAKVTSSGPGTVLLRSTNATWWYTSFRVIQLHDVKSSSPCDAALGQYSSGTGTSIDGPTATTTTECNEWLVGNITYSGTLTPTSSTTVVTDPVYYKHASSVMTQSESLTGTSSSSGAWDVLLAVFKSASGTCSGGGSTIAARRTPKNPRTGSRQAQ